MDFNKHIQAKESKKSLINVVNLPNLNHFTIIKPEEGEMKRIRKSVSFDNFPHQLNFLQQEEDKPVKKGILRNNSKKLEKEGALLKSFLKGEMQKKKIRKTITHVPKMTSSLSSKGIKFSSNHLVKEKNDPKEIRRDTKKGEDAAIISSIVEKIYGANNTEDFKESQQLIQRKSIYRGLTLGHSTVSKFSRNNFNFEPNIMKLISDDDEETQKETQKNLLKRNKFVFNKDRELLNFHNVYDSFSEEEEEKEYIDDTNMFYIHPNKKFKVIWDTICSIFILYSMILTPYRLAFENDAEDVFYYIELFIEFIFFMDLIFSFFTAYFRYDILVTNSSKIIWNYIQSYFLIDLISSIPLGTVFFILQKFTLLNGSYKNFKSFTQLIRFYRLVKWVRILRLFKISKTENSELWKIMNKVINNVFLKFLIYFIIMVYFTSCLWCFIGKSEMDMNTYSNWIKKAGIDESPNMDVFVSSIYFVCATIFTIGYGDLVASSIIEKIFVSFLMIIGSFVWSFVLTSLSFYFSIKDESKIAFEAKMKIFEEINRDYILPHKLADRVKKYLSFEFAKYNKDQVSLVANLPTNLKNNLLINMYKKHITHLRFFEDQSYDFIISVLPLLKCVRNLKNEYIINIGSHVEGIYMVYHGQLAVHLGSLYEHFEIARISSSYHIGDILMYANDQSPYDVRVRSVRAEMLILSKQDFASLKLLFKEAVHKILIQSNILYEEIEMKKIAAIEYHKIYGTMKEFKISQKNPLLEMNDSFIISRKSESSSSGSVLSEVKEEAEENYQSDKLDSNKNLSNNDSSKDSVSPKDSDKSSVNNSLSKSIKLLNLNKKIQKSKFSPEKNFLNHLHSIEPNKLENSEIIPSNSKNLLIYLAINNEKNSEVIIIKNINLNNENKVPTSLNIKPERILKPPERKSHSDNSIVSSVNNTTNRAPIKKDKHTQFMNNRQKQVFQFKKHAETFLDHINEKIVNEAILMKNKEIMSEYLKEVLKNEKFEEVKFKNLFGKLEKIENKLKNVKKIQIKISSNFKRHKTVFD